MGVSRLTIIKLAELILAIACLFIHFQTFEAESSFNLIVVTSTLGGYAIIVIGVFIGYITGNPINRNVDLFYLIVGAILYILSGIFTYQRFSGWTLNKSHANLGITKGVLAVIQGIVFIVDGFFTFRAE